MSTTSILDRFLEPVVEFLPADAAQKIIDLRIDPELQSRLDVLAEKANQGSLSGDERAELREVCRRVGCHRYFQAEGSGRIASPTT